jgi:probable F420-dependent oxidoreductase
VKYGICTIKTRASRWAELAQRAEQLGYESVWGADHLVFPVDMSSWKPGEVAPDGRTGTVLKPPPTMPTWDSVGALTYLAAATSTIRLGTCVYLYGLRHPFVAARAWQTLDYFSGGRAIVGVGVGWLESEYRATEMGWRSRGRRLDESLEISQRLWSEPVVEHHGEFYDFEPVSFEPKPIQAPLPIHVGGESNAALRRVARFGSGWLSVEHTPDTFAEPYGRLVKILADAGRSVDEIEITVFRHPESQDDVDRWEEKYGVKRIILFPGSRATGGDSFVAIEQFAEDFELGS